MARQPRKNAISGRVDDPAFEEIKKYTDLAKIDIAELVRLGVMEYMQRHPATRSRMS